MTKEHVEICYKAQPVEDEQGHLTGLKVRRQVFRAPRTVAGSVQWRQGEYTDSDTFEVAVMEVSILVKELVSWLEYFASGNVEKDRA